MARGARRQVILELVGDASILTCLDLRRRGPVVVASASGPGPGEPADLHDRLAALLDEAGWARAAVHVLLSDDPFRSFRLSLPRLERGELQKVVLREARVHCKATENEPLFVSHRRSKVRTGTLYEHEVTVLPRATVSYLEPVLADPRFTVASFAPRGDAVAETLPDDAPDTIGLLERMPVGVRFSYLKHWVHESTRVIRLPDDVQADPERLAPVMKTEIGRSLDYLSTLGHEPPEALAFDAALGLSREVKEEASRGLSVFDLTDGATVGDARSEVSLAVAGYLRHLTGTGRLLVVDLTPPPEPWALLAPLAVGGTAVLAGCLGLWMLFAGREAERRIAAAEDELGELRAESARLDLADAAGLDVPVGVDLEMLLTKRRPASALVAEVCNRCPEGIELTRVGFDELDVVAVEGIAWGAERLTSIRILELYRASLEELAYLQDIRERIEYVPEPDAHLVGALGFTLRARWGGGAP